jgi:hypothetical protein
MGACDCGAWDCQTCGQVVYIGLNGQGQIIGVWAREEDAQANTTYITAIMVKR